MNRYGTGKIIINSIWNIKSLREMMKRSLNNNKSTSLPIVQGDDGICSGTGVTTPSLNQIADIPPNSEVYACNALLGIITEHC
jgi:hypothetical protein